MICSHKKATIVQEKIYEQNNRIHINRREHQKKILKLSLELSFKKIIEQVLANANTIRVNAVRVKIMYLEKTRIVKIEFDDSESKNFKDELKKTIETLQYNNKNQ